MELAYQLKIDVQKKEKEIIELDTKVKNLEKDKERMVSYHYVSYSYMILNII